MEEMSEKTLSETENEVRPEVSEASTIEVENVEKAEASDITPAETVENAKKDVKTIDEDHKKYLIERAKEAKIDWDTIEFEDAEKQIPLLTDEDRNFFISIAEGYFDRELLDLYIDESIGTIRQYFEIKAIVDSGDADEADMAYYEELSKGFQDAKIVLASIQVESRQLAKSFKESKVSEDFIKAITLKSLHDFLVKRFRLTDTWKNHSKKFSEEELKNISREKLIEDNILNKMYVTTMFNEYVYRYAVKQNYHNDKTKNVLSPQFYEDSIDLFINALKEHINHVKDKSNIDLAGLIDRDFKYMEFIKAPIVYALIKHGDPVGELSSDKELLSTKLNPGEKFNDKFDKLYEVTLKLQKLLNDSKYVDELYDDYLDMIITDKIYASVIGPEIGSLQYADYKAVITSITQHMPDIEGTDIREWSKWYKFMRKYEIFYSIYSLKNYTPEEMPEGEKEKYNEAGISFQKEKLIFNVIMGMVKEFYDYLYSNMIVDVTEFIKYQLSDKSVRPFLFEVIMNSLGLQHHLGYISTLELDHEPKDENDDGKGSTSGEKIYDFAKSQMGEKQFDYFIVDKENDILLKDVDLLETRGFYIDIATDAVELLISALNKYSSDVIHVVEKPVSHGKKSSRKNRGKRRR